MKLLIVCVESNKNAKTDAAYIEKAIKEYYVINNDVKLSFIFMNSKSEYRKQKYAKEIEQLRNYVGKDNTRVLFCVDTDNYDTSSEDQKLNDEIQKYCNDKDYSFVWFCKCIEEVFLHTKVSSHNKVSESKKFGAADGLKFATKENLSSKSMSQYKSNILLEIGNFINHK